MLTIIIYYHYYDYYHSYSIIIIVIIVVVVAVAATNLTLFSLPLLLRLFTSCVSTILFSSNSQHRTLVVLLRGHPVFRTLAKCCIFLFARKWSLFTDSWILFESMLIPPKELTKLSLLCGGGAIHASGLSLGPWLWGLLRGFPFLFLFRLRVALVCDRTASCSHDSIQHSITKALGRHWNCNETYTHLSH